MSYKTILVHIDSGKHTEKRLAVAINLTKKYDAYLVGLYVFSPYIPPGYIMAQMGEEIEAAQNKIAVESMSRAEDVFRKQTSAAGLDDIEWQTAYTEPVHAMSLHAQYADLVVIGQSDSGDDSGVDMDFPERLVLTAGQPVLILRMPVISPPSENVLSLPATAVKKSTSEPFKCSAFSQVCGQGLCHGGQLRNQHERYYPKRNRWFIIWNALVSRQKLKTCTASRLMSAMNCCQVIRLICRSDCDGRAHRTFPS